MEVTCTRNTRRANVLWNVEQVVDARRKSQDVQPSVIGVYGLVALTEPRSVQSGITQCLSQARINWGGLWQERHLALKLLR